jgi:hypothetical protein
MGMFGVSKLAFFVVDKRKQPPMPCSAKRARHLRRRGGANLRPRHPFTIRPNDGEVPPARIELDPSAIAIADLERGARP